MVTPVSSRLYLMTPEEGDDAGLLECLKAAASAGDIAALLVRAHSEDALARRAALMTQTAQDHDIAVLIDNNVNITIDSGADGVHLSQEAVAQPGAIESARKNLPGGSSVGVVAPNSRHEAMELAEQEPDYIGFEVPEMAMWWAPLFEVPCVAIPPASLETAVNLSQAGVEFICPTLEIWANKVEASRVAQQFTDALADESSVA